MATKNRLRNATIAESNKISLAHFTETPMWRLLRPIDTAMVDSQNEFKEAREPTVPYESDVQVPVKHDFSETFYREKFDGFFLEKVSGIILLII